MSSNNAVELKGGLYTFMSLRLRTDDLSAIDAALADKVQQAPSFFADTPVVVDLGELDDDNTDIDSEALLACIRRHKLLPIVASVGNKSSPLALEIALPLMESNVRRRTTEASNREGDDASSDATTNAKAKLTNEPGGTGTSGTGDSAETPGSSSSQASSGDSNESRTSLAESALALSQEIEHVIRTPLLVDRPVRSGQQIYARETDLIVMGQVGPGAEVIADSNIHIYGPLRGRALCGVSGNTEARIFCQSLEAELVSVAGNYRMLETIPEDLRGRPAQIWLDNDRLNIEPL